MKVILLRDVMPPDLVAKYPSLATLRRRLLWRAFHERADWVKVVDGWIGGAS